MNETLINEGPNWHAIETICLFSCFENLTIFFQYVFFQRTHLFASANSICLIGINFIFLFGSSEKHTCRNIFQCSFLSVCLRTLWNCFFGQENDTHQKLKTEKKKSKRKREKNEIDDHLPINPCLWYNQRAKCHSNNIVTSCYLVYSQFAPYLALIKFMSALFFTFWMKSVDSFPTSLHYIRNTCSFTTRRLN